MNESMQSRLCRLLAQDPDIYKVEVPIKCKTKDGMIYTMECIEVEREKCPKEIPFEDYVHSIACQGLLHLHDLVEGPDGFRLSMHELVSVRGSEIVRIWAELGDIHTEGPIIE